MIGASGKLSAKIRVVGVMIASAMASSCGGGAAPDKKVSSQDPATDEGFTNPDGDSTSSSYLIEKVVGVPDKFSNATSLSITITRRNGESKFRYKVANSTFEIRECYGARGWSDWTTATQITIDASSLTDGDALLCVAAITPAEEKDSNPVAFKWLHDITPPDAPTAARMIAPEPPLTVSTSREVKLRWIPPEDVEPENDAAPSLMKEQKVLVGTSAGSGDVLEQKYGITDYEAIITLPGDGEFYFSVVSVDYAGNETKTLLPSMIAVDTSPPPAPTSVTWNPEGPVNYLTGISVSWPAVIESTSVTYQYKVGTSVGGADAVPVSTAQTTQANLTLSGPGTYFFSVKAINSVLQESAWFNSPVPFYIDQTKPVPEPFNVPDNGQAFYLDAINFQVADGARNELAIHEYQYKIITGDDCDAMGAWSTWLPNSTPMTANIKGPAYETTMSLCMRVRDAAGNESEPANDKVRTWNNQNGTETPNFSDPVTARISYSSGGVIKDFTSASGNWVANANSSTASWSGVNGRTVTTYEGAQFTGVDTTTANVRKTTITRSPAPGAESGLDAVHDLSLIPGDSGKWCLGDLYLLDLATDTGSGTENFYALVSCITADDASQQKIRVVHYDAGPSFAPSPAWNSYSIVSRASTTKALGAISVSGEILVAIVDPTDSNKVYTCGSPPDDSTLLNCQSANKWKEVQGSEGTTALAALVPSSNNGIARLVIAGSLTGAARLGVASGSRTGTLDLRWMATGLGNADTFSLNPYLIELP